MIEFRRSRDRIHRSSLIFISDEELAERGVNDETRIGYQLKYNDVVHSIRGINIHGILIWPLGEKGPV